MRSNDIYNMTVRLHAIEKQIEYYTNLNYSESVNYSCNNVPHLCMGLDEEDFYEVKQKLVSLLQEKYNKKLNKITTTANNIKYS